MSTARLQVRVHAGASRQQIGELRDGVLTVRVSTPPLDGRANKAVCQLVAKHLAVAPSRVRIAHGTRSRNKLLEIQELGQAELEERLHRPPTGD